MALNNNNIDQAHTYIIQDFVENISYRKSAAVHTHTHTNKTIGVWGTYRHFIERAISGKCLLVKRQFQYNVSPSTYKCIDLIIYGWKRPYKFFINTEFGCSLNLFSFWRGFSSIFFFLLYAIIFKGSIRMSWKFYSKNKVVYVFRKMVEGGDEKEHGKIYIYATTANVKFNGIFSKEKFDDFPIV